MRPQPDVPAGEVRVDELSADDAPALLAFYRDLAEPIVRAYRPYGWDVTEQALRDGPVARTAAGDEIGLVLRDEGDNIWGHAFLADVKTGSAHAGVGVHQTLLGQGLGRKLMTALLVEAGHQPALGEVRLICVQDNAAAVALYTSLGFEITGAQTGKDDGLAYHEMRKTVHR